MPGALLWLLPLPLSKTGWCSQERACGDEGTSVRELLVVLALEVRT